MELAWACLVDGQKQLIEWDSGVGKAYFEMFLCSGFTFFQTR